MVRMDMLPGVGVPFEVSEVATVTQVQFSMYAPVSVVVTTVVFKGGSGFDGKRD
jgi:hypothetical protein